MITLFADGHAKCTVKETGHFDDKTGRVVHYDLSTEVEFSSAVRYELRKDGMIPIRVTPTGFYGPVLHTILRHETLMQDPHIPTPQ